MECLHLIVVLATCYFRVHEFGSLSGLGTLEVEVLPAVVAVVYHVPCHLWTALWLSTYFLHIPHFLLW